MRLKLTQPGWESFTGHLGMTEFNAGVTVEMVARTQRDMIAALVQCVEVNDAGDETGQAGVAARLVGGATIPAEVLEPRARQTDDEKKQEIIDSKTDKPPTKIYTSAELEAIGTTTGIKGLREVAGPWNVKGRGIAEIIGEIVKAQSAFTKRQAEQKEKAKVQAETSLKTALDAQADREEKINATARVLTPTVGEASALARVEADRKPVQVDSTPNTVNEDGKSVFAPSAPPAPAAASEFTES